MKEEGEYPDLELWKIHLHDDPQFQSAVWREIATRDASSLSNRLREVLEQLTQPRVAIPVASAAIVAVLLSATLHGIRNRERAWENLAWAYSSTIDPTSHRDAAPSSPLEDK